MTDEIRQAVSFFLPSDEISDLYSLGTGNVNDTWLVVTVADDKYVLQRLNPNVFPDPGLVQDNLHTLTNHLQTQLKQTDKDFVTLRVLCNPNGIASYVAPDGSWWRLLSYINESQTLNTVSTAEQAREIGCALGLFHQLTSSLHPSLLSDTLPGFHITPLYLQQYDALLPTAMEYAGDCLDFIDNRRKNVSLLEDARKLGTVREQVIHGDPKVGNFLFSLNGNRVISLIDLDTVKSGLLLHDIGDCLRSCCNRSGENIQTPDDIVFDQGLFTAMLKGYFSSASELLTDLDKSLIVDSVRLISFELGLRFYTDHIAGNRYFKVTGPGQNLFRARVQFALVRSIECQYTELKEICTTVQE